MKVEITVTSDDTTSLSYWLNWRVFLCAIWVLTPMIFALWMICKCKQINGLSEAERSEVQQDQDWPFRGDEAWRPSLNKIHPIWLLFYRLVSFFLLLVTLVFKVFISGGRIYLYYTQWTFTLLTIYFGCGSLLSVVGCFQYMRLSRFSKNETGCDTEQGLRTPLVSDETKNLSVKRNTSTPREEKDSVLISLHICTYLFEILFQINAGAVMLTDAIYWFIIFPFLTIQDYSPSLLAIVMHSINAVLLLGDSALNCLQVPFFCISFFILWTGVYVIFQWIVHACEPIWWPYPFLDLSSPYAPLWYLLVAIMHIPSYGLFALIVKAKLYFLEKWFPHSCQCSKKYGGTIHD